MTIREWLRANNYNDVAGLIDDVMAEFEAAGSGERRNWADVLSGGKDGKPVVVAGRTFPVLRAAQISRGKRVTANAIWRNENEEFPGVRRTGRWPTKKTVRRRTAKVKPRRPHARAS